MTCEECEILASRYVDGELDDGGTGPMFEHLSSCRACREFLLGMLTVRAAMNRTVLGPEIHPSLSHRARPGRIAPMKTHAFIRDRDLISSPVRFLKKRVVVSIASILVTLLCTAALAISIAGRWHGAAAVGISGNQEIIYVTTLPVVDVTVTHPGGSAPHRRWRTQ